MVDRNLLSFGSLWHRVLCHSKSRVDGSRPSHCWIFEAVGYTSFTALMCYACDEMLIMGVLCCIGHGSICQTLRNFPVCKFQNVQVNVNLLSTFQLFTCADAMQLNGTFDVKLGKSFLEPSSATYITMRCDFMPASVDRTKPGSIRVDESKEVVVNLPNVASVAAGSTVFRGSARPVQKECILIYNKRVRFVTFGHEMRLILLSYFSSRAQYAFLLKHN